MILWGKMHEIVCRMQKCEPVSDVRQIEIESIFGESVQTQHNSENLVSIVLADLPSPNLLLGDKLLDGRAHSSA